LKNMATSLAYRLFVKVFAKTIVNDLYLSILGRAPDEAGGSAYTDHLKRHGGLEIVASDMVTSEEGQRRSLASQAAVLVEQLAMGLRGATPAAGEQAAWTGRLHSAQALAQLANDIATGPDHLKRTLQNDPQPMVEAAFRSLLGRQPDEGGRAAYAGFLSRTGDVESVLRDLAESAEHQGLVARQALLGREPAAAEVATYRPMLGNPEAFASFVAQIAQSPEHRKWVLLRRP
jgi:Domain of unknown function (DUF4214)